MDNAKIVVISGPTGSGKNSILKGILERSTDDTARLVTATTRAQREGEEHERDHYFLSKVEFLKGIDEGTIPEHWYAPETDRYYGTYLPDLEKKLAQGKTVVAEVQIEGFRFFKKQFKALGIFIVAESYEELERRVRDRQQDISENELSERLQKARQEVDEYSKEYDYTVVNVRGKLEEAIEEVMDILRKEQYL
ncbi:guanylate kinase [bacterium]|nr:guanylate kinase [bacterium]|tara:strand:+ start:954 stop:1535 length:582 start_codon:yes stop_codon:yes gene_type:complete